MELTTLLLLTSLATAPQPAITPASIEEAIRAEVVEQSPPPCPYGFKVIYTGGSIEYQCCDAPKRTALDWVITGSLAINGGLMAGDVITTVQALSVGATEANPIMKSFIEKHPVWAMMSKGAITTLSILAADRVRDKGYKKLALIISVANNIFMGWVVAHNFEIYKRRVSAAGR